VKNVAPDSLHPSESAPKHKLFVNDISTVCPIILDSPFPTRSNAAGKLPPSQDDLQAEGYRELTVFEQDVPPKLQECFAALSTPHTFRRRNVVIFVRALMGDALGANRVRPRVVANLQRQSG
jgi:hypothetical protein